MRVVITAGGTGGHIYPALAILDYIKEREPDSEFIYIGTHNRMEKDIVPKRGIKYEAICIYGLSTSLKLMGRNIKNVFLINKAYKRCVEIIKDFKPDVVIGVGVYVTYPVIKAAHACHVKTFIHEQNSIPGKANKGLLKWVDVVGVSFDESKKYIKHDKVVLTGNPVSEKALKAEVIPKTKYGLDKNKKSILIFNGSLGSGSVNLKMLDFLSTVGDEKYQILYITGNGFYDKFKNSNLPKNVFIYPYVDNLSGLMKDMDLIICRAGASSIAEITALGLPVIFIPSPYVANNHQYYNARAIIDAEAGDMILEQDLTSEVLKEHIDAIINDEASMRNMSKNLKKLSINDSATKIYNEIKDMLS